MLQAFDLKQIEKDLRTNDLVLIEIYPDLWPRLLERLHQRFGVQLTTTSVFMTAVDPGIILGFPDKESRTEYISKEVKQNLLWRNKDKVDDIEIRAGSAAREILDAIGPEGRSMYAKIIHSAPEGPDGEDDWTREALPVGRAKETIKEFVEFYNNLG
jgi:hypothetical protein